MAPEQFMDLGDTDPRADVYTLGKMLYEAVEGKMVDNKTACPLKGVCLSNPLPVLEGVGRHCRRGYRRGFKAKNSVREGTSRGFGKAAGESRGIGAATTQRSSPQANNCHSCCLTCDCCRVQSVSSLHHDTRSSHARAHFCA